ncbi:MAG: hypothetical protein EHM58_01260 [Ignavibacteriae bacterium]|nr:MAG: hypothetical protein EHM58_01260 [Ignavibacteriota bacterium]
MNIDYKKIVTVDELAHLVPTKAGATFSQLWQVFYYTRLFKYVHIRQYQLIKKSFTKICTYKKLSELCELGYLKSPRHEVYAATNKVLPILNEAGYVTEILPPETVGKGDLNELHNTDVFVRCLKLPHFYTLLFPRFGYPVYLIPDALLVQKDENLSRYKLTFLEIEEPKPQWNSGWLEHKKDNYVRLSHDAALYAYWKNICRLIRLPMPDISALKFSVHFIGDISKDFGKGFSCGVI